MANATAGQVHGPPGRLAILVLATFLALFIPRAGTPADKGAKSGFRGTVMKGPNCPGPGRIGHPCPDKPVVATFQVTDSKGAQVAKFTSDELGRFEVALPPGTYSLVPDREARAANPGANSTQVIVRKGEMTEVKIFWDTGMR
jgi:hypothetical protein